MIADEIISTTGSIAEAAADSLVSLIRGLYSDVDWETGKSVTRWTEENKESLWRYALHTPDRKFIEDHSSQAAYYAWLGDMHKLEVTVASRHLFGDEQVRDNVGWRLTLLSLPAPRAFVVGLAHHYQGSPAQSRLGAVSNSLYALLEQQLRERGVQVSLGDLGRPIEGRDWDQGGLTTPDQEIAGTLWPGELPIRVARNTTTKKTLSTFITIRRIGPGVTDRELRELLGRFRSVMHLMVAEG